MSLSDEAILVIAPHCDDEALGVGGALALAFRARAHVRVCVAVGAPGYQKHAGRFISGEERERELRAALSALGSQDPESDCRVWWRDGRLGDAGSEITMRALVGRIEGEVAEWKPGIIFFPYASHHQDHQLLYRASVAALRPVPGTPTVRATMLMYEYPYVHAHGDFAVAGSASVYVPLDEDALERKLDALDAHVSQKRERLSLLSRESAELLARMRGREIGREAAERFYLWRSVWELCDAEP